MWNILDSITGNNYYHPKDIKKVIKILKPSLTLDTKKMEYKTIDYYNIPCAFDIETSSFYNEYDEKVGLMYEWTFGINGLIIIGRAWNEFINMIDEIVKMLKLSEERRLIVYAHNLEYEFQFLQSRLKWKKIFAVESRQPLYALTDNGIEFRCSYKLSGYGLAALAGQIQSIKINKLIGELDYNIIRHKKTIMTDKEIEYCLNDVKIPMLYIYEKIMQEGGISKLPLTKTGAVRKYCHEKCLYPNGYLNEDYRYIMESLKLTWVEYLQLKRAMQGGFTHASAFRANKTLKDVESADICSSYPYVMVSEKYPMSSSEYIHAKDLTQEIFEKSLEEYCCLFDIELKNLRPKLLQDYPLSSSRCYSTIEALFESEILKIRNKGDKEKEKVKKRKKKNKKEINETDIFKDINWKDYGLKNAVIVNGRIYSCDLVWTTVTEQDFMILRTFYEFDKPFKVRNFRRYKKSVLPKEFVTAILKLYNDKTKLKGVEGKESIYIIVKELLNACFGMTCTDIYRPEHIYDPIENKWKDPRFPDLKMAIEDYNKDKDRFLFYPWGVWITAYARRNLFHAIMKLGNDYVYSDTDSVKYINGYKHREFFINRNKEIRDKLIYMMTKEHHLNPDLIEPKTIKGVKKCLGQWEFDGHYSEFKTLGAKRYLVRYSNDKRNPKEKQGKYEITVAGLDKEKAIIYMLDKYKNNIFDYFNVDLTIPAEYSGRLTHSYIDKPRTGYVTDYNGVKCQYNELTGLHMENSAHSLSDASYFIKYLLAIEEMEGCY